MPWTCSPHRQQVTTVVGEDVSSARRLAPRVAPKAASGQGATVAAVVTAIRPVALAGLLLAGCTVAPTAPPIIVPNVGGMWAGTWGGTPVTLLITDHRDDAPSGAGVYVGAWLLLGGPTPGLSGGVSYNPPR